ncbi:MAG: hypothetical protein ACXABY_30680 [Candidatus Thorarchaeota archaeon]
MKHRIDPEIEKKFFESDFFKAFDTAFESIQTFCEENGLEFDHIKQSIIPSRCSIVFTMNNMPYVLEIRQHKEGELGVTHTAP